MDPPPKLGLHAQSAPEAFTQPTPPLIPEDASLRTKASTRSCPSPVLLGWRTHSLAASHLQDVDSVSINQLAASWHMLSQSPNGRVSVTMGHCLNLCFQVLGVS